MGTTTTASMARGRLRPSPRRRLALPMAPVSTTATLASTSPSTPASTDPPATPTMATTDSTRKSHIFPEYCRTNLMNQSILPNCKCSSIEVFLENSIYVQIKLFPEIAFLLTDLQDQLN